jgi:hypothetical protein
VWRVLELAALPFEDWAPGVYDGKYVYVEIRYVARMAFGGVWLE